MTEARALDWTLICAIPSRAVVHGSDLLDLDVAENAFLLFDSLSDDNVSSKILGRGLGRCNVRHHTVAHCAGDYSRLTKRPIG